MYSNSNLHSPIARTNVATDEAIRQLLTTEFGYVYDTVVSESRLVLERRGGGYELHEADAYTKAQADSAEVFLRFARERSRMRDETLVRKSLHSLAFTLRHRCNAFTVPSKAVGTAEPERQKRLWRLVGQRVGFGTPLEVNEVTDEKRVRLVLSLDDEELGEAASKWVPIIRPLRTWGTGVRIVRITGHEHEGYRLGLHICFTHLSASISALNRALGADLDPGLGGEGVSGDGAAQRPVEAPPVEVQPLPGHGGDGAAGGLRLVSSALVVAKPQADTDTDDILLYRDINGTARATVEHVQRHSHAFEWHSLGAGASDLAYSILVALFDEETAERWHVAFKEDVISRVPRAGGVIRTAAVRAWVAEQEGRR